LDSYFPRKGDEEKPPVLSDLRRRLDRLIEPRRARVTGGGYAAEGKSIEELLDGQFVSTPFGEVFVVREIYGHGHRHGGTLLADLLEGTFWKCPTIRPIS